MAAALKPGGWLLVEELVPPITDPLDQSADPDIEVVHKARRAIVEMIRRRGGDPVFAWQVPDLIAKAGLTQFAAEGYFVPFRTDAIAGLAKANIDQLGAAIVEAGLMDAAELGRFSHYPRAPRLSISRIDGTDFRVGTAMTVITFERTGHGRAPAPMRHGNWVNRLVSVLACMLVVVAGCGENASTPAGPSLTPVRVAMFPAGNTLPVHAAFTNGIFERNGLRVEITEGQDLPVFMAALAKGQYDVVMSVPTLVLIGGGEGP